MIVQATDGLFYVSPIINGDHAFLTFENDYPEVVVRSKSGQYARRYIRQFGGKYVSFEGLNRYLFPEGDFREGVSLRVTLCEPIPVPDIHKGSVSSLSTPPYLVWHYYWSVNDVRALTPALLSFLYGVPTWETEKYRRRGQCLIRKQIPEIKNTPLKEVLVCTDAYWRHKNG